MRSGRRQPGAAWWPSFGATRVGPPSTSALPVRAPTQPDLTWRTCGVRLSGDSRWRWARPAAGAPPLLLVGPPGAGKTMLAERLPGLLPPLPLAQAVEVTRIHSAA